MTKNRLEAFSDGVLAIIITIMVLEIKVPHGDSFRDLAQLYPKFLSYILSFLYIAIYWNNHHHLMHTVTKVKSGVLWSNMLLLFSLSLVPFSTAWLGENNFACHPMIFYGFTLLLSAISYWILTQQIIKVDPENSILKKAIGVDIKGKISIVIYLIGIISAFYINWIAPICYMLVALLWLIPDKRIEKVLS